MDRYKLQSDLFKGSPAVLAGYANALEHWDKAMTETSVKYGK